VRWAAIGLVLAACGRVGFDPPGSLGDDAVDPDARLGDGATGGDDAPMIDASMIDALPAACAQAITVNVGRTGPTSTCTHPDLIDACGPAGRQEVVFKLTAPASGSYTVAAYTPGTQNISNSTQLLDASCNVLPGCAALTGRSFAAGQVVYFVVEASSAACTMIELSIAQS